MKKILAIILSLVILSNLTVSVALAQEPKVSLSESKSNILKSMLEPEQKNTKLTDKEKQIESLKKEIHKIENMSDKDYRWNKFKSILKTFFTTYLIGFATFMGGYKGFTESSIKNAYEKGKIEGASANALRVIVLNNALNECRANCMGNILKANYHDSILDKNSTRVFAKEVLKVFHPDKFKGTVSPEKADNLVLKANELLASCK